MNPHGPWDGFAARPAPRGSWSVNEYLLLYEIRHPAGIMDA
jgi:hypothetical protein